MKIFQKFAAGLFGLLILFSLIHCSASDKPLSIGEPGTPGGPVGPPGGDGSGGGLGDACVVQFKALIQLKLSANPVGASSPLEILDAAPFEIDGTIPIRVEGNQISLAGQEFPDIFFRPEETAADIKISAAKDRVITGVYDPANGAMSFDDFVFVVQVVKKGEETLFLEGEKELPPLELTTGTVNADGNLNPITESGQNFNPEDRSLALVAGITLPTDFGSLAPLNSIIGGGALIARLEGILDQAPENCGSGEGGFAETEPIDGVRVQVQNQTPIDRIDFGSATVVLRKQKDQLVLDCREALNRGLLHKRVTLSSTGSREVTLNLPQPSDTDSDLPSPLCSGSSEFVRGTVTTEGAASCETIQVGGKTFFSGTCTLPADPQSKISFPMMYLPFNYQVPGEDGLPVVDQGRFTVTADSGESFSITMSGRSLPDIGDTFSLAKVFADQISEKRIFRGGLLKFSLGEEDPVPAVQEMVLLNSGVDVWEPVQFNLDKGSDFKILPVASPMLPAGQTEGPGILQFKVEFQPHAGNFFQDVLHISMVRQGSVTPDNPEGVRVEFQVNLLGTVGVPPLLGKWKLHFDFLTALIDHVALSEPIESNDFRQRPDLAIAPLDLEFSNSELEGVQNVEMKFLNIDILDPSLTAEDRKKVLRIFTARASRKANGDPFAPGDNVDDCAQAQNLNQAYQNGDCSYFYWTVEESPMGLYDDETGQLTLPAISMRMLNPYHADIFGIWPPSNPAASPDYILDVPIQLSFTTHLLNQLKLEEAGLSPLTLVPDQRISLSDLVMRNKRLGADCPEGFLEGVHPKLKCYLTDDEKFLTGMPLTLREGFTDQYYINLVGVTRLPPGNTDPSIPWFLGDDGGSRLYIAIQGRLCPEDSACEFE